MNKCPSPESGQAGKADSCKGCPNAEKCASAKPDPDIQIIRENLTSVKATVAVLSGKGGVGKSTISCNLSRSLASKGFRTLLLDFDLSGPSIPRLTNTLDHFTPLDDGSQRLSPLRVGTNLYTLSVGYLEGLEGPVSTFNTSTKNSIIKNILKMANFEDIDIMIIDTPPNIVEEHLALVNYMKPLSAIMITTPQNFSINDVRRQVSFCRKTQLPIIGVVENMKSFICGHCSYENRLFGRSNVQSFCSELSLPYLGSLSLDQRIARNSDEGVAVDDPLFDHIADHVITATGI